MTKKRFNLLKDIKQFRFDKLSSFKSLLLLCSIYIITQLLTIYYFLNIQSLEQKIYLDNFLKKTQKSYTLAQRTLDNKVALFIINNLDKSELTSIISTIDKNNIDLKRDLLLEKLNYIYKKLLNDNIEIMHFHLPRAISFLRMHSPKNYGDDLSVVRPSIMEVNEKKEYLTGYETGKYLSAFRHISPLFNNKELIGTLEIAYSEAKLLQELESESETKFLFMVNKNFIDEKFVENKLAIYKDSKIDKDFYILSSIEKSLKSSFDNYDELMNQIEKLNLEFNSKAFTAHLELDKNYIVSFVPVKNIDGKNMAYLIAFDEDKNLSSLRNHYFINLLMSSIALLLIFIFFIIRQIQNDKILLKQKYFDSIFNTQKDMIILTEGANLSDGNMAFLNFFNFKTLTEFQEKHSCICEFFDVIDREDFIDENMYDTNWLESVFDNTEIDYKVQITKDEQKYIFSIEANKLSFDKFQRSVVVLKDVTQMFNIQNSLERRVVSRTKELNRYIELVDQNVIIASVDKDGIINYVSKAYESISGYKKSELIGKHHTITYHRDNPKNLKSKIWEAVLAGKHWSGEIKNIKKDKNIYWSYATIYPNFDNSEKIAGYMAIIKDVTSKKQIEQLSITDELTGLYNRRYFNEMIVTKLKEAIANKINFAFFMMDIDNFKKYNDNYGHQAGDDALQRVGAVLKNSVNSENYIFRLGGEEFGVIFSPNSYPEAIEFVEMIREAIYKDEITHAYNEEYGFVTGSFGLVFSENPSKITEDEVYRISDELLYESKARGRNRVTAYMHI